MRIHYEKGDRVAIKGNSTFLTNNLKDFIKDENGRNKIIADIVGTRGVVYGVVENEGHIQALYQKENSEHTWKLPVTIFEPILIGVL